jgi:hypothetical protein
VILDIVKRIPESTQIAVVLSPFASEKHAANVKDVPRLVVSTVTTLDMSDFNDPEWEESAFAAATAAESHG